MTSSRSWGGRESGRLATKVVGDSGSLVRSPVQGVSILQVCLKIVLLMPSAARILDRLSGLFDANWGATILKEFRVKPECCQDSWFCLKVEQYFSLYAVFDGHGSKGTRPLPYPRDGAF